MASDLLGKLGLRLATVAAVSATALTLTTLPSTAGTAVQKASTAAVLHDYGTSLTNPADTAAVVADNNNNNKNNNIKPSLNSGLKPTGLSNLA